MTALLKAARCSRRPGPTRYTRSSAPPTGSSRRVGHISTAGLSRPGRGVTHFALLTDARIYGQVIGALGGRCLAAFG